MFNSKPRGTIRNNNHQKSIFSCNVYKTNNEQRSHVRTSATFKLPSAGTSSTKDPEVLYYNDKILRHKNKCKIKECSTQTSKTILQLAQNDLVSLNPIKSSEKSPSPYLKQPEVTKEDQLPDNTNVKLQPNLLKKRQPSHHNPQNNMKQNIEPQSQDRQAIGKGCCNQNISPQKCLCAEYYNQINYNNNDNLNTQRTYNVNDSRPVPNDFNSRCCCLKNPNPYCQMFQPNHKNFKAQHFPGAPKNDLSESPLVPDLSKNQTYPESAGDTMNARNSSHVKYLKPEEEKLNELDTGRMSPDSLAASPRQDTNKFSLENCPYSVANCLSDFTLDGSCYEQDCIFNSSKNLLEKPLTQTYLEKNRGKILDKGCPSTGYFKSKSFVDNYQHPNYIREPIKKIKLPTRFVRLARNSSRSLDLPDNSFMRKKSSVGPSTLMCPTLASNIKSQMDDIQNTYLLIPNMRRGRSVSPQPVMKRKTLEASKKIPYIDNNRSDVSSSTTLINATRHPEMLRLQQIEDSNGEKNGSDEDTSYKISEDNFSLRSNVDMSNSSINDTTITTAIGNFCNPDWRISLKGLADIVEICRVSDIDTVYEYMGSINQQLVHLLKSPRTHVSRTACKAAGHLFEYVKDTRRPIFDEIVDILLHKTADANKFIRQDANLALDCMVTHISIFNAVRALCAKGPFHKNALVRCATARLLVCAVVIAGTDFLFNPNSNDYTRKTIILNMVRLLEDKNIDTRRVAERLYKVLSKDMRFDIYLRKYLEKDQIDKIKRNLILVRKK